MLVGQCNTQYHTGQAIEGPRSAGGQDLVSIESYYIYGVQDDGIGPATGKPGYLAGLVCYFPIYIQKAILYKEQLT